MMFSLFLWQTFAANLISFIKGKDMAQQEEIKIIAAFDDNGAEKKVDSTRKTIASLRKEIKGYTDDLLNQNKGSEEYNQTLGKIKAAEEEIRKVNEAVREATKGVTETREKNTKTTEKNASATRELRNRIKELTDVMIENGRGTKQYDEALTERIELQTRLNQSNEDLRAGTMNLTDVYGSVTNVAKGIVGGFSSLLSITALLGQENSKLAETLVRVQAAMTLISSLTALSGSFKSLRNLVILADTSFKGFNATLLSNPLVIVGVAVVAFTGYLWAMKDATEAQTEAQTELNKITNQYNTGIEAGNNILETKIAFMRAENATEKDIIRVRIAEALRQREAAEKAISDLEEEAAARRKTFGLSKEEQKILADQLKERRKDIEKYNKDISALQTQFGIATVAQFTSDEKKRKAAEEAARKQREVNAKQANAKLLAEQKQFETLRSSIESTSIKRSVKEQKEYVTKLLDDSRDITLSYAERTKALQNYQQALTVLNNLEKKALEDETKLVNQTIKILDLQKEQEQIGRDLQILRTSEAKYAKENYDLRRDDLLLQEQENDAALVRIQDRLNTEELSNEKRIALIEEYNNRLIKSGQIQKQQADLTKSLEAAKRQALEQTLAVASSTLSSLSTLIGEQTAAGKVAAIASTTIDTYRSATGAFSALSSIPFVGPALGYAAAGAAIASGLANVKNILSVKVPGTSDTSATVATPSIPSFPEQVQPIQETHNNLTAYDEEILNQDRKVYVTEQDISRTQARVREVEDKSTY